MNTQEYRTPGRHPVTLTDPEGVEADRLIAALFGDIRDELGMSDDRSASPGESGPTDIDRIWGY